jgi:ribose transport system ATP-binding protein
MPAALSVSGLSKTFAVTRAVKDLDLEIRPGEIRALVGENGSGKSTVIKILAGYHTADPGARLFVAGREIGGGDPEESHAAGLRVVHQDLGLLHSLTVADNLFFGTRFPTRFGAVSKRRTGSLTREALARVGLDIDPWKKVADLMPAERTGVAVARSLYGGDLSLLVLDEPTATLHSGEARDLLDIVRAVAVSGAGVLYVSHRLEEVFALAHTVTVLRDGAEVATRPTSELDTPTLVDLLVGGVAEIAQRKPNAQPPTVGAARLDVHELTTTGVIDVSLTARAGEIVGIAGLTGSGRESICSAIYGTQHRFGGQVSIDGSAVAPGRPDVCADLGTAFIPADRAREGGCMELSARENLGLNTVETSWRFPLLRRRMEREAAARSFEELHIRPQGAYEQPLRLFSGGNQQKIILGRWLRRQPRLFLLEEPTQGVDIATKAFIHAQLRAAAQSGSAVVVSSSDVEELNVLCDRVLVMRERRLASELSESRLSVSGITRECLAATRMVSP